MHLEEVVKEVTNVFGNKVQESVSNSESTVLGDIYLYLQRASDTVTSVCVSVCVIGLSPLGVVEKGRGDGTEASGVRMKER